MGGRSWPPSFLLPSSPALWMWPVLMSTKLLHGMCVPRTHFCLFSSSCKCMPVAKGSTVPTQIRAASRCSKCLTPAYFTKHSGTRIMENRAKHQADGPLVRTLAWHLQHPRTDRHSQSQRDANPLFSSPCPCPMHFLSSRLHLPVWMLLRLTSGQQQPCPFPCSVPVRHLSPDHNTAAGISWRGVWNVNSLRYLTHPREINGSSGQRGKLQAASLRKQHLGKSIGDALYLPGLSLTSCTIIFKNLAAGKAKPFPSEE